MTNLEHLTKALRDAQRAIDPLRTIDGGAGNQVSLVIEEADAYERSLKALLSPETETVLRTLDQQRQQLEQAAFGLFPSVPEFSASLPGFQTQTHELFAPLEREIEAARVTAERFLLPEVSAVETLLNQYRQIGLDDVLSRYSETSDSVQAALQAMRTPWLDALEPARSISEFAKLMGIGSLVERFPAFDDHVSETLRADLGDWRESFVWTEDLLGDAARRRQVYADIGFDLALTDFPTPAFQQGLTLARLHPKAARLADEYGPPVILSPNDEEDAVRANEAHETLFKLEVALRRFIDAVLTEVFGQDWPQSRLPPGMYERWSDKKTRTEQIGKRVRPLIEYADFTDYEQIICLKRNWRDAFEAIFCRKQHIEECFYRLRPIRLNTMHARTVSQEDILLLYVEASRLFKTIVR